MDNKTYFKDSFESINAYKKTVLIKFIIQNDRDLLHEIGFSERDINRLNLEFKNIIKEHHEQYLDYFKNEEGSVIVRFLNK